MFRGQQISSTYCIIPLMRTDLIAKKKPGLYLSEQISLSVDNSKCGLGERQYRDVSSFGTEATLREDADILHAFYEVLFSSRARG